MQQRGPGRGRGGQVGPAADRLAMLDIIQIGEHNTHYKWMFECLILVCFLGGDNVAVDSTIYKQLSFVLSNPNSVTISEMSDLLQEGLSLPRAEGCPR